MKCSSSFYIPVTYTLSTRIVSIKQFISWVIIYVIPMLFICLLYRGAINIFDVFISALSILLVYNNYELGYIYNDTERIKKEKKPTIRLSISNLDFYQSHKASIIICRLIISLALSFFIYYKHGNIAFILSAWIILFVFYMYNLTFSSWGIFLHLLLVSLRYCSIALLFGVLNINFLFLFLLFPFPNSVERTKEKKFRINIFRSVLQDIDKFRFYYYLLLFVCVFTYNLLPAAELNVYMVAFSIYYLLYRAMIYFCNLRSLKNIIE